MKPIVLILFLLTACGKNSDKKNCFNCNQTKPIAPSSPDLSSQVQPDSEINKPIQASGFNLNPVLLQETTNKESCLISFPKNAENLSQFQADIQITQKQGSITVQSFITVKVFKDSSDSNIYYSESPTLNLEIQSDTIVNFITGEQDQKKKYSCAFK